MGVVVVVIDRQLEGRVGRMEEKKLWVRQRWRGANTGAGIETRMKGCGREAERVNRTVV